MYIKEELEVMLKQHKKNEAKITELELKEEEFEERLKYAGTVHTESKNEIIEGMQLSGPVLSNLPKSDSNRVSDVTYKTMINYNKESYHINYEDRVYIENQLNKFKNEKNKLDKQVIRIKNLLEQLSVEEKFIIETYYMEKSKWDYVERMYFNEFEIHKSIKQLQSYRDNAIESMLDILNTGLN